MTSAPPPGDDPAGRKEEFLTWPDGTGAHLVVPDDLAELHDEVLALRHERLLARRAARRASWSRWVPHAWRRYGATAPLLIVSMLLIGAFGALLVLFSPRGRISNPSAVTLATPSIRAGRVGGLLPNVTVDTLNNSPVGTRDLERPSLVLLLPAVCADCAATVRHVVASSEPYTTMARYVVATTTADARRFAATTGDPIIGLVDHGGGLLAELAAGAAGPTLAVIGNDGTIRDLVDDVNSDTALTGALDKAVRPSLSAQASS
jgi:hypothetical protein